MTDEATPVPTETPAAPAPEPTQPEPTPEAMPEPEQTQFRGGRREARAAAREAAKKMYQSATAEPEEPAQPTDGEPAPETGGDEPEPAPQASEESAEAEPETGPEPIRVEIAGDHPVRGMGRDAISVADPEDEPVVRALLKGTYNRRRDVAERDQTISELQNRIARLEAGPAAAEKYRQTPEYEADVAKYHRLRELEQAGELEEGTALAFWNASGSAKLTELEQEEREKRLTEFEEQQAVRDGEAWIVDAYDRTSAVPENIRNLPDFKTWFGQAVDMFNARIESGHYDHIQNVTDVTKRHDAMHREFASLFSALLKTQPSVQQTLREKRQQPDPDRERELEAARREGAEKALRDGANRRTEMPPNPLAAGGTNGRTAAPEPEKPDTRFMTPAQLRKAAKQGAREDARKFAGLRR